MRRSVLSLVIGIGLAIAAVILLMNSQRTDSSGETIAAVPTTRVMVASRDLQYGDKILPDMVRMIDWPTAALPNDVIPTRSELLEGPDTPRIALRPFAAGEPYLKAKVSGFGERPILSRRLGEGMRAFTVRINDVSGVAGFLLPGDRVDVMLTRQVDGRSGPSGMATDVILQDVAVLGIDQLASELVDDPVVAKSATFEVTTEQAQKLALASQVGTLSLALRNSATAGQEATKQISANDLGERQAAPAPVRRAAPRRDTGVYVSVRRGTDVSSQRVGQ